MNQTRTVLQVPMSKELRQTALAAAVDEGYSSLQELTRVLLKQFSKRHAAREQFPPVQLSPKAIKRYDKMSDEIESGKVKPFTANTPEELFEHLDNL